MEDILSISEKHKITDNVIFSLDNLIKRAKFDYHHLNEWLVIMRGLSYKRLTTIFELKGLRTITAILLALVTYNSSAQINRISGKLMLSRASFQRMDAGAIYGLELRGDTLWGWGRNVNGQLGDGTKNDRDTPIKIGNTYNWVSVSAGYNHSFGIKNDGTLYGWGLNNNGQLGDGTTNDQTSPVQIGTDNTWISVKPGGVFTLGLKANGTIWAWGSNSNGQLGDGTTTPRTTPVQVGTGNTWVNISVGFSNSYGLKSDGTLWAWGANNVGQIGDNTTTQRLTPVQVTTATSWVSIATGYSHVIALRSDGTIWGWGSNGSGQAGDGTMVDRKNPAKIGTATDWVKIGSGDESYHSFGIKSDGTMWAWGDNEFGKLGIGNTTDKLSPYRLSASGANWVSVSSGHHFSLGQKSDGRIYSWGVNDYGQLGTPYTTVEYAPKYAIDTGNKWIGIAGGMYHTAALKSNGSLWLWGGNDSGQLGDGTTIGKSKPVQIRSSIDWISSVTGYNYTMGLKNNGTLWAWGANGSGQLGDGTTNNRLSPVQVGTANDWASISLGEKHSVGIKTNGSLWAWGENASGQLGDGSTTNRNKPIQIDSISQLWIQVASGGKHTIGLRADGTLWAWGANSDGQLGDGGISTYRIAPYQIGTGTNWVSIKAGRLHSVALKSDGTLWVWGNNDNSQLGDGSTTKRMSPVQLGTGSNWIAISAGEAYTLGLKSDGTLWAWGYNGQGQFGDGTNTSTTTPVQISNGSNCVNFVAGVNHSMIIKPERGKYCISGNNNYGQLGDGTTSNSNAFICNTHTPLLTEINVKGNNKNIPDGKTNCLSIDGTDFGGIAFNSNITKTYKIFNTGNDSLQISNINTTGANANRFIVQVFTYPLNINPGDSLSVTVNFKPAVVGLKTATLNIINNDLNESIYDFSMQGVGIAPEIDMKGNNKPILDGDTVPWALDNTDFLNVPIFNSSVRTFKILNTGTDSLKINNVSITGVNSGEFVVQSINYPLKIKAGDSLSVNVTFTPKSKGLRKVTFNISNNDVNESNYDFSIQGNGSVPEINVKGNYVSISDGDITPSALDSTDFGNNSVNKAYIKTYKIFNAGTEILSIGKIYKTGINRSEFNLQSFTYPIKINAGDSFSLPVTFIPASTGIRSAVLNIESNDSDNLTFDFAIKGNGIAPEIEVKGNNVLISDGTTFPSTIDNTDFGNLQINNSDVKIYKIFNRGTGILTITGINSTGTNASEFVVYSFTFPQKISVGDSLPLSVTFTPLAAGLRKATIHISSDDSSENDFDFAIQGTGTMPKIPEINIQGNNVTITDGDLIPSLTDYTDFGNVTVNNSIIRTFTIQNTGTSNLTISGISKSGADSSLFTIGALTPASPIFTNASSTFTVTFTPASAGLKTAILKIINNDADEGNYHFAIQGTADPKTGISPITQKIADLKLYPNPANNLVSVIFPEGSTEAMISVYSSDGKILMKRSFIGSETANINVMDWENGIYLVNITMYGKIETRKLNVQR